jgi:hypothetical protein
VTKIGSLLPVAEFDWLPNSERNVLGYRVYRPGGSLACPGSASTLDLTSSCIDFAPVDGLYSVMALYRDAGGVLRQGPASTITVKPLQPLFFAYYFKDTTNFTGSSCAAANGQRDADDGYAGGTEVSFSYAASITSLNFCTRSLASADSAAAGTTNVYAWATNSGGSQCTVTAAISVNGGSSIATGGASVAGNTSTPAPLAWALTTPSVAFASGDRLNVRFTTPNGASCNSTNIVYAGTTRRARVELPNPQGNLPPGTPLAPTGLQGVANADGSKTLTWTAPTSGNPIAFYRIYRDGVEYTNRYDTTGDPTPSYSDPSGDGIQHSYYITAVSTNLAESSYVGPVTP